MFMRINPFAFINVNTLAKEMTAASDGVLRIAHGEADNGQEVDKESGTFLKIGDRRIGKDFEYYNALGALQPLDAYQKVLFEIVLPVSVVAPNAYQKGLTTLTAHSDFLGDDKKSLQRAIFNLQNPTF